MIWRRLLSVMLCAVWLAGCDEPATSTASDKEALEVHAPASWISRHSLALSSTPAVSAALPAQATAAEFGYAPWRRYARIQDQSYVDYRAVSAHDFTGDGRTDLLAFSYSPQPELFVQQPNGTLAAPFFLTGNGFSQVRAVPAGVFGDFNEDGLMDMVFYAEDSTTFLPRVGVMLSSRSRGMPVYQTGFSGEEAQYAYTATLDIDGDGHLDLLASFIIDNSVGPSSQCSGPTYCPRYAVLYGDGHGRFGRPQVVVLDVPLAISHMQARDLNSDGLPDLVLVMTGFAGYPPSYPGKVMVSYRQPKGGLSAPRELFPGYWGGSPGFLVFGDISGDGMDDAVLSHGIQSLDTEIRLRSVDDSFGKSLALQHANLYPEMQFLADLDGDGYTDLVNHQFGYFGTMPYLAVYLQRDGVLQAPFTIQDPDIAVYIPEGPLAYAAADLNGDGCNDLVMAASSAGLLFLDGMNCAVRQRHKPDESGSVRRRPTGG